ncbi:MAG: aminopeptidase P family protein [Oscillospiraceae bacterium]|nr:aminopeptidase P family protein [Oscillospiraceae bacterium]
MKIAELITSSLTDSRQAALVTSQVNRRYITGFNSSSGIIVITKDRKYFLTDSRYYDKAVEMVHGYKVVLLKDVKEQLDYIFIKHRIDTVSVENQTMTLAGLEKYKEMFSHIEFDTSNWLSDLIVKKRMIKTSDELSKIEAAQRIAERAFSKLLTKLRPGITEKQVAAVLNYYMSELGSDGEAFPIIAASGKNSAVPHSSPTSKELVEGEFIIIDFGAVVDGYHSDMTRTVVIGNPTEAMKRVYDAVWSANTDVLKAVRPDITGKLLDNVARSTLEAWGYESYFGHGLGHGVGLEVHETPTISSKADATLRENMVFTVEPGVYIPHKFGVRIEDMIVVTKNGCVNLTKTPKTLIQV